MTQKKAVRHAEPPKSLSGWFVRYRFGIARRIAQLAVLALFAGTARLGWTLLGRPILSGDLSASLVLGTIPLSDPFALIQKLAAGLMPEVTLIVGALLVLAGYILLGGRSFCAWVCPMNSVTDFADWVRVKLGIKTDWVRLSSKTRYAVALGALIASAVTGSAAFEWISPQAWLWREVVWGFGLGGASAVLGVFALDLLVVRRGWCGHLCPLGAFWSCAGKVGVIKPVFNDSLCTRCGDCLKVCPEPGVINFNQAAGRGFITGMECTNCGRCVAVCPEKALTFGVRPLGRKVIAVLPDTENNSTNRRQ